MADRLLSTLLRSLQTYTDQQDTPRYATTSRNALLANSLVASWERRRLFLHPSGTLTTSAFSLLTF